MQKYYIVQELSNKQNVSKRQTSHVSIGNLLATHAFDYIYSSQVPGLISCEDLTMALLKVMLSHYIRLRPRPIHQ